jgi:putative hemolysin
LEPAYQQAFTTLLSGISPGAPDSRLIIELAAVLLLLAGSAMMSAAESAYFTSRKEILRTLRVRNGRQARIAMNLYNNPEKLLGTIILANNSFNIAMIFVAVFASLRMFDPGSHLSGFIISLAMATFLLLLIGEILPKIYSSKKYIPTVLFMAYPLSLLVKILSPLTFFVLFLSGMFRNRHAGEETEEYAAMNGNHKDTDEDKKIMKGIANFGNTNVSAIMCPRIDVTAIDIKSEFDMIIPVIIKSGFSRIPVYSGSFDTVKGILYAKDVLPYNNNPPGFKWQSLLRPSYFVPETKKINDLLKEFQMRKIHMAIVIDEYGGTSGIVTLEDILEEIVGEITDESDEVETLFRKTGDTTWIFDGKILLHDFCRILDIDEDIFNAVRGESETLAGLLLELAGEIPQKDHVINYNDFVFRIESVDRRRIKEIRVETGRKNEEA